MVTTTARERERKHTKNKTLNTIYERISHKQIKDENSKKATAKHVDKWTERKEKSKKKSRREYDDIQYAKTFYPCHFHSINTKMQFQ